MPHPEEQLTQDKIVLQLTETCSRSMAHADIVRRVATFTDELHSPNRIVAGLARRGLALVCSSWVVGDRESLGYIGKIPLADLIFGWTCQKLLRRAVAAENSESDKGTSNNG
jgi:hypothetical protein